MAPAQQVVDFFGKRVLLTQREVDDAWVETLALGRLRTKSLILRRNDAGHWSANLEVCDSFDRGVVSLAGRGKSAQAAVGALETEVVIAREMLAW